MALLSVVLERSKALLTFRAKELSESELDVVGDVDDEGEDEGSLRRRRLDRPRLDLAILLLVFLVLATSLVVDSPRHHRHLLEVHRRVSPGGFEGSASKCSSSASDEC